MGSYQISRDLFVCIDSNYPECNATVYWQEDLTALCIDVWRALLSQAPVCVICPSTKEAAAFMQCFLVSMGYQPERALEEAQRLFGDTPLLAEKPRLPDQLGFQFMRFKKIVEVLRQRCPWDKDVTPYQLVILSREELSELMTAISKDDVENYAEELGDLFLHLMLHITIAEESNTFTMNTVLSKASEKAISRHPHVFALERDENAAVVLDKWQRRKKKKPDSRPPDPTVWALRLQDEAKHLGLDWKEAKEILVKLSEEAHELESVMDEPNPDKLKDEIGDLFFTVINLARHLEVDPEDALLHATSKFERRMKYVKDHLGEKDIDSLWEDSKRALG